MDSKPWMSRSATSGGTSGTVTRIWISVVASSWSPTVSMYTSGAMAIRPLSQCVISMRCRSCRPMEKASDISVSIGPARNTSQPPSRESPLRITGQSQRASSARLWSKRSESCTGSPTAISCVSTRASITACPRTVSPQINSPAKASIQAKDGRLLSTAIE